MDGGKGRQGSGPEGAERDEYLRDLRDWNEHMYSPGHWTGGRIPPALKYGGRGLGAVLVLGGLSGLLPLLGGGYSLFNLSTWFLVPLSVLLLAGGLKRLLTGRRGRS